MKTHSWLKRMQFEQRPSGEVSKPEQRICWGRASATEEGKEKQKNAWRLGSYLSPTAITTCNGRALTGRGLLVVMVRVVVRRRTTLLHSVLVGGREHRVGRGTVG